MTTTQRASERITEEAPHQGAAGPGSRGEFSFKVGRREIGHLARPRPAHRLPEGALAQLRPGADRIPPGLFRASLLSRIENDEDVREAIALLWLNYERVASANRPAA